MQVVRELLLATKRDIAAAAHVLDLRDLHRLHGAEQVELLLRLAADTGARRGELAALRQQDLTGRVLSLDRGVLTRS